MQLGCKWHFTNVTLCIALCIVDIMYNVWIESAYYVNKISVRLFEY